jgi:hypothetical protein
MATPTYQGSGHPPAGNSGGWLGNVGSYFGVGTPSYGGNGQPSSAGSGLFGGGQPAYKPAPAAAPSSTDDACDAPETVACPIDAEALASGQIAIVIPRQGP